MKKTCITLVALIAIATVAAPAQAKKSKAATTEPAAADSQTPEQKQSASDKSIDKQAAGIVQALNLNDSAKAERVQAILVTDLKTVRDWHNAHPAPKSTTKPSIPGLAQAEEDAKISPAVREQFLRDLSTELSPEQVTAIKDKLTINKVKITYDAYLEIVPNLTEEDKAFIMQSLEQARDESLDMKNMEEKSAIFKVYKNKIKAYLDAHGHDVNQAYKDWGAAQKAKKAAKPATRPAGLND